MNLLHDIKKQYAEELRSNFQLLRLLLGSEPGKNYSVGQANQLYRIVHTIKGTAPVLGMDRVGAIALKLDQRWQWVCESEETADSHFQLHFLASAEYTSRRLDEMEMEVELFLHEIALDETQEESDCLNNNKLMNSRLLVIEDDSALRSYLTWRLRLDGYEVDQASDVTTAITLLKENTYHLVTVDLMMHPQSGYEIFELLKDDPMIKWLPMIVLSGRSDIRDMIRCFQLGADDFIAKPFRYEELSARIQRLLMRNREFEFMAFNDPLTGINNRRFFDRQIQVELDRIHSFPAPITMVIADIDHFKKINDTHGHHIGDIVLQGFAHLLQRSVRKTDTVARIGGEEFAIVMPNTNEEEAAGIMSLILEKVRTHPIVSDAKQTYGITFSAGISEWSKGLSVKDWTRLADYALYKAKRNGRNRTARSSMRLAKKMNSITTARITVQGTILLADDDRILRTMIADKLNSLPYQLTEVSDGEEAYRLIVDERPDLCILDGIMPGLTGFEVLERLRKEGTRPPNTKILFLSGRNGDEDIRKGLSLGVDRYLTKPVSLMEIEIIVKDLLNSR